MFDEVDDLCSAAETLVQHTMEGGERGGGGGFDQFICKLPAARP
jgi:hypothetical protein